jgi:hypothetical protein
VVGNAWRALGHGQLVIGHALDLGHDEAKIPHRSTRGKANMSPF